MISVCWLQFNILRGRNGKLAEKQEAITGKLKGAFIGVLLREIIREPKASRREL